MTTTDTLPNVQQMMQRARPPRIPVPLMRKPPRSQRKTCPNHPVCLAMDTKRSLKTRCSETNEEFDRRVVDRQTELKAVIDSICTLNSDTSFDTHDKTVSTDFLQMSPLAGEQALRQRALSVLRDAVNKVVDDPVVQIPQAHVAEKTIEITQLDADEKIVRAMASRTESSSGQWNRSLTFQFSRLWRNRRRPPRFSQDRAQQHFGGQIEPPAVSLTEKTVEMPVIRTKEKTQHVVNTHVQHVVNTVEVVRPKLKETQQRKKPTINEKIHAR